MIEAIERSKQEEILMKKVLLLMNAQSGQGKGKELCYRVVEGLSVLGCMVTVFPILPKHKNLRTEELVK